MELLTDRNPLLTCLIRKRIKWEIRETDES